MATSRPTATSRATRSSSTARRQSDCSAGSRNTRGARRRTPRLRDPGSCSRNGKERRGEGRKDAKARVSSPRQKARNRRLRNLYRRMSAPSSSSAPTHTVVVGRGGDIGCRQYRSLRRRRPRRPSFSLGLLVPVTAFDRERRRSVGVHELVGHGVVRAGPRVLDDAGVVVVDREVDQISETRRLGLGRLWTDSGEPNRGDPLRELGSGRPGTRGTPARPA